MRSKTLVGFSAVIACFLILNEFSVRLANAQNDPGKGWIEGVVITEKGKPACSASSNSMVCWSPKVTIRPKEGAGVFTDCDPDKGGFFSLRNLRPGIYEVFVDKTLGRDRDDMVKMRPQHIFGLVVEPDKRTVLNITVHEGEILEEIGKPDVASEKAIVLANELTRLKQDIDDLKRIVEEAKRK
jgi:hypothetical protein